MAVTTQAVNAQHPNPNKKEAKGRRQAIQIAQASSQVRTACKVVECKDGGHVIHI